MTRPQDFQRGLELYANSSEVQPKEECWRKRLGHLPRYAAAVSSALALTTSANASIVYSGFLGRTVAGGSFGSAVPAQIAIGPAHFTMQQFAVSPFGYVAIMSFFPFELGAPPFPSAGSLLLAASHSRFAKRLNAGSTVPTGGAFGQTGVLLNRNGNGQLGGQWIPGQPAFAGIRFFESDGAHYGWLRLIVRQGTSGIPTGGTIVDWAYDTAPNESIVAGDGVSGTPEPNAEPLLLLALGAVGVLAWRRKRSETLAEPAVD